MTELAYMIREDWAGDGTAMPAQSAVIRGWFGGAAPIIAVRDDAAFADARPADSEAAAFIASENETQAVVGIRALARMAQRDDMVGASVLVLHPFEEADLDALARAVQRGSLVRVFVLVWSPRDIVRKWLDGLGAVDLHTGGTAPVSDAVMVEAGRMMVNEEYNGLRSGHGKDSVVQLVRAFTAAGYALDVDAWLRAYFAGGGSFRHGSSVQTLVGEMARGVQHRVKPRYRENIVDILRTRAAASSK